MEKLNKRKIAIYCLLILGLILTFNISALYCEESGDKLLKNFESYKPDIPLIPGDVKFGDEFVKGVGKKVGVINEVKGSAYVIHSGEKIAYPLMKEDPLFVNDTLITLPKSRLKAVMNDKSVLALAPQAKLTIDKLEYAWFGNKRSTVMNLVWGSARFIVKKLSGKPDFKVKTKTAVCGTRATDFIVSVAPASEDKKVSILDHLLNYLSFVKEAYALTPGQTITTVLTGPKSTVELTGTVGEKSIVGPASIAGAVGGSPATDATFVGNEAADAVLGSVGPDLDSTSSASKPSITIDIDPEGGGKEGKEKESGGGGDSHDHGNY